ncbi:MAG: 3-dehydroquinate synthase [Planctomycetota bacterium]|nr:MAG: 3-dehydroquinate synthase [Planctomycetota bacterium]
MSEFPASSAADRYDIEFSVPMVHRLRFTRDCLGDEFPVLAELMEPGDNSVARAQVWIDAGLLDWDPHLSRRIERQFARYPHLDLVAPVEALPGGEAVKNDPAIIDHLLECIHRDDLDRRSYIVVIGGGAVLDAVGFAAAVAHRGIRLIRLPTTTLAQADSGVGVKNAVNWFNKKNWKGTFATPWAVVNDEKLLEGLPDREFRCGFSEAVKVALLKDPAFFDFLHTHADRIADREIEAVRTAVRQSVLLHLQHITRGGDPFETREARPLDFGHWSAHKLESLTRYRVRHGEAVAMGIAIDVAYSHLKLGLPRGVVDRTLDTLRRLRLPTWHPGLAKDAVFEGLEEFRQHLGGRLTITLIRDVGRPVDVHEVDLAVMRDAIELAQSLDASTTESGEGPAMTSACPSSSVSTDPPHE